MIDPLAAHLVDMPDELDILPLFGMVVYPQVVMPLAIGQPASLRLLGAATRDPAMVGMVALRSEQMRPEPVQPEDCYRVGTLVLVHRLLRLPDETLRVAVQGLERFEIIEFLPGQEHLRARVRVLPEQRPDDAAAIMAHMQILAAQACQLADSVPNFSDELLAQIRNEDDPVRLTYLIAAAALLRRSVAERQDLLEVSDLALRSDRLAAMLTDDLQLLQRGAALVSGHGQPASQMQPISDLQPLQLPDNLAGYANRPGSILWLGWTPTGPGCVVIEAAQMAGSKQFWLTGSHDDRLRDVAYVALSWVRSESAQLGLLPRFFDDIDLHVHISVSVVPDDLVAAGMGIATALVSLLTNRPVVEGVALTGKMTLHGHILPVGRIDEKVLAAYQTGIKEFVLPSGNAPDLAALAADVRADIICTYVDHIEQVLEVVLQRG